LLFGRAHGTDKDWWSHVGQYTALPPNWSALALSPVKVGYFCCDAKIRRGATEFVGEASRSHVDDRYGL
jgi:hypothetical protein